MNAAWLKNQDGYQYGRRNQQYAISQKLSDIET